MGLNRKSKKEHYVNNAEDYFLFW